MADTDQNSKLTIPEDFQPNIALRNAIHWHIQNPNSEEHKQAFYRCLCRDSVLVGTLVDASPSSDRCTQTAYDINLFTVDNENNESCLIGFTDMDAFHRVVPPDCGISAMTCKQLMEIVWAYGHSHLYISIGSHSVAVEKQKLEALLEK